ncbi:SIR2 family protein [Bradyrhizobium sp. DASA03068]|uniref:SIR2 family protein n=1 Tax=Bradyrhizobium sp. BLXBL-01 TaxID=3395915 RepID=UPI003F6FFC6E
MKEIALPTAATISILETIELLEGSFKEFSKGFRTGMYALWLGSAISRERVVGLDGVLSKLLESLRQLVTANEGCPHRKAFSQILDLADLSSDVRAQIDFNVPVANWPLQKEIVDRLWNKYSKVLGIEVSGKPLDYLLWDVLDFKRTFAAQRADAEHLVIGMLVLEGAVSELATANWDALLESAMMELGRPNETYQVAVTGSDLRGPTAIGKLYKFHGCARRAIEDESNYRPLLVAREPMIIHWFQNPKFSQMRDQLKALLARSRTLMVGLSAQDANIQQLFGANGWNWNDDPAPIIFSAQELTDGQKSILEGAYQPNYEAHRDKICSNARLPVFSKALLLALLLDVLGGKVAALAASVEAPNLSKTERQRLAEGIVTLRDRAAKFGNADRYAFATSIAQVIGRFAEQLRGGKSLPGPRPYIPISPNPEHLMQQDASIAFTGQAEAAAALAIIGREVEGSRWDICVDDPTDARSGALRICTPNATARVFFAASDDNISSLLNAGAFDESDPDVVVICSRKVAPRQQRSPSASLRTGKAEPRYIGFGELLSDEKSLEDIRQRFLAEVGL